jgi:hypothetical protein
MPIREHSLPSVFCNYNIIFHDFSLIHMKATSGWRVIESLSHKAGGSS